jgi:hypothetical protein
MKKDEQFRTLEAEEKASNEIAHKEFLENLPFFTWSGDIEKNYLRHRNPFWIPKSKIKEKEK